MIGFAPRATSMNTSLAAVSHLKKKFPFLSAAKRRLFETFNVEGRRGTSHLDVLSAFPLYVPNSAGTYAMRAALTIQTIQNTPPFLENFVASLGHPLLNPIPVETLVTNDRDKSEVDELKKILDSHRSDKARKHNYHYLYGTVLKNRNDVTAVLEIGLGTNNTDVVSNMGKDGVPGASLRAFRDFLPNARIYGADIDRNILFSEERIKTFYVDQTVPATCTDLMKEISEELDLIIDDGLHSVDANLAVLAAGLPHLKVGGWVIIEDIAHNTLPFWRTVAALLPHEYKATVFSANDALMVGVTRIS